MHRTLKENRGLTLLELLVALVMSSIVIAALYRTFVGQQRTYTIQEQVIDMRQNARGATGNMIRELRMSGFGHLPRILPLTFDLSGSTVTYNNIINHDTPSTGWITVVTALHSASAGAKLKTIDLSKTKITVDNTDDFDDNLKKYISIGGIEDNMILPMGVNTVTKELTLERKVIYDHPLDTRIYPVRAISYKVTGDRDENTGGGAQPVAQNVENVQFEYLNNAGTTATSDQDTTMIKVSVTARTDLPDPQYQSGDGYRRRQVSSNVQVRNIGIYQSSEFVMQ